MFGYITICEPELKVKDLRKYRAHYCGLCRTLKEKYGSLGQLTLSYDIHCRAFELTVRIDAEKLGPPVQDASNKKAEDAAE